MDFKSGKMNQAMTIICFQKVLHGHFTDVKLHIQSKNATVFAHLIILAVYEGKFKFKLRWINFKNPCFAFSVKTIDTASL